MKADACFKFFGQYINFYIGQEEKLGRIVRISIDSENKMVVGIDEDGYLEEYELAKVQVAMKNENQKTLMKEIIKQVRKDIDTFKYDLGKYREEETLQILQKISDEDIKGGIEKSLDFDNQLDSCSSVYSLISQTALPQEEKDLLCGVVAYKQHDLDMAYSIFSRRWLADKNDPDVCRDFILVADKFDNDVLCFFLLKHFFNINGRYLDDKYYKNLWWKYLSYAMKYNDFGLLANMDITESNARTLLDSFIYIFHMYNLEHQAVGLTNQFVHGNNTTLKRDKADVRDIHETIGELNLYKNYLPDTAEGYYLRFELCMERILASYESGRVDMSEDEKTGYIYEFVKSRNYGFIIGCDFIQYFYHENELSTNKKKRVMDNIYSNKDIASEDKIYVHFQSVGENKKVQAINII